MCCEQYKKDPWDLKHYEEKMQAVTEEYDAWVLKEQCGVKECDEDCMTLSHRMAEEQMIQDYLYFNEGYSNDTKTCNI
jgi:hypothetical protein